MVLSLPDVCPTTLGEVTAWQEDLAPDAELKVFFVTVDPEREEVIGDREASEMLVRPYRAPWDAELKAVGINA